MAGPSAGRRGGRWRTLHAEVRSWRQPCAICRQPIDYSLSHPDPRSFSVDHRLPRSTHPHLAEDLGNLRPAHLGCNSSIGTKPDKPSLGSTSRNW